MLAPVLQPGMESEFRMASKQGDEEAITVFAENLRHYY
jgi:hypothetical protein